MKQFNGPKLLSQLCACLQHEGSKVAHQINLSYDDPTPAPLEYRLLQVPLCLHEHEGSKVAHQIILSYNDPTPALLEYRLLQVPFPATLQS
jgi:hypothetical protein